MGFQGLEGLRTKSRNVGLCKWNSMNTLWRRTTSICGDFKNISYQHADGVGQGQDRLDIIKKGLSSVGQVGNLQPSSHLCSTVSIILWSYEYRFWIWIFIFLWALRTFMLSNSSSVQSLVSLFFLQPLLQYWSISLFHPEFNQELCLDWFSTCLSFIHQQNLLSACYVPRTGNTKGGKNWWMLALVMWPPHICRILAILTCVSLKIRFSWKRISIES